MLIAAAAAFLVGLVLSIQAQPQVLSQLQWFPILLIALIIVPATLTLNAMEFALSARMIGHSIRFGPALETTIVGTAANLLPLPGSTIVRVAALKAAGATLTRGFSTTALTAVIWIGVAFGYAGLWSLQIGGWLPGFGLAITGSAVLAASALIASRYFDSPHIVLVLILNRLGLVSLDAVRTYLAFAALGEASTLAQASILTVSTVLGYCVAFVPGGLGVREGIAALIAPLLGLQSASAFLAISLSRIVGLGAVMLAAAALGALRRPAKSR